MSSYKKTIKNFQKLQKATKQLQKATKKLQQRYEKLRKASKNYKKLEFPSFKIIPNAKLFGGIWGFLGPSRGGLGASSGALGPVWGVSWNLLGGSWGVLVSPSPSTGLGGTPSRPPFPPLISPQLHLNFTTQNHLNSTPLLTRRGAHFDPLGRPKSTPNRPKSALEPSFSPKSRFSKKRAPPRARARF